MFRCQVGLDLHFIRYICFICLGWAFFWEVSIFQIYVECARLRISLLYASDSHEASVLIFLVWRIYVSRSPKEAGPTFFLVIYETLLIIGIYLCLESTQFHFDRATDCTGSGPFGSSLFSAVKPPRYFLQSVLDLFPDPGVLTAHDCSPIPFQPYGI